MPSGGAAVYMGAYYNASRMTQRLAHLVTSLLCLFFGCGVGRRFFFVDDYLIVKTVGLMWAIDEVRTKSMKVLVSTVLAWL